MITRKPHVPVRRFPISAFVSTQRPWLFAGAALVSILSTGVLAAPTPSCDVDGIHYAHCGAAGATGGDGTATEGGVGGAGYSNPDGSVSTGGAGGAPGLPGADGSGPHGGSGGELGDGATGGGSDSGGGGGFGLYDYGGSGGGGGGEIGSVLSGGGSVASSLGGNGGDGGEDFGGSGHVSYPDRMGGPGGGGSGVWLTDDQHYTVAADGTITGGTGGGGWNAGDGGNGVTVGASGTVLDNAGTIVGGESGYGDFGFGGVGVYFAGVGTLTNTGHINGGAGPGYVNGGTGGNGVTLVHGSDTTSNQLDNKGAISGGDSGGANVGGDGGNGVLLTYGTLDNSGVIAGGNGNNAYDSHYNNGNGGDAVTGSDFTLANTGTLTGGNAGLTAGSGGDGGVGVHGKNLSIITSGQIAGGLNGDGVSHANAITFTGGTNRLEIRSGSTITGNVDAITGTDDTFALGGSANATFDVSTLGDAAQYRGFDHFEKAGTSTWTLTGATSTATPWTLSQGTLSISSDGNLGNAAGDLTFDGGTLRNTAAFTTERNIVLNAGGGTFQTDADLTASGAIVGAGELIKTGIGTLTLNGDNEVGPFTVHDGSLVVDGGTLDQPDYVSGSRNYVGENTGDDASLVITNGGKLFAANALDIGYSLDSQGSITVSGDGSSLRADTTLGIGNFGDGTLSVEDKGYASAAFLYVGASDPGTQGAGVFSVSGTGSAADIGTLGIGYSDGSTGAATLSDGGTLEVKYNISMGAQNTIGSATLNIGAASTDPADAVAPGTLHALRMNFYHDSASLNFNHTGNTYVFDTPLASANAGAGFINHYAGNTTLTGDSADFSGDTLIHGGTLAVNGSLGGTVAVESGATLGGSGTVGTTTVADGGHIAPGNSVGVLEVAGDLILNGGSMLDFELGSPGSAADPASGASDRVDVTGDLTLDGTLNLTQSTDSADGAAGFGYYRLLTYGGDLTDNGLDISAPLTLTGPGRYEVQAGAGNVDLLITALGDDTLQHWRGGDGTWNATNVQWLNQGSTVPVAWAGNHAVFKNEPDGFSGGTIAVEGTQSFKGLQFVDDGYYLEGTGTLLTDAASNAEIRVLASATAQIATTIAGSGGITKTQGGTLVLAGANTYGGDTTINGGTLELVAGGSVGTGSVTVDDSAGQNAMLKVDSGASLSNLILLGNDGRLNNQGDISNSSDIAAVTTAGSLGHVVNHGGGSIEGASFGVLLFDGGSVINRGAGSEIRASGADGWALTIGDSSGALLNTNQARIEGTQVGAALGNGGVIDNRDGASIAGGQVGVMLLKGGTVRNDASAIIETTGSAAGDCNASGDCAILVSTTGSDHGGALTLVNAGRILGDVQMDASAANVTTLMAGGVIEGDLLMGSNTASTLTLDDGNGAQQRYSEAVTGVTTFAGTLTKNGSGVWVIDNAGLSGVASTTVAGGALIVGGSAGDGAVLGGDVNIDAGALLGGHGTIGGNVINAGILAPGNSVGTLNVAGDITFADKSSYLVEVDPASSDSDQVHATGTATLNGGSVVHIGENGTYRPDSSYRILTADGGITGTFADVASNFAFLDPTLVYDPNSVVLRLTRNDMNFCMAGMTANQCATGSGAESTGSGSPIYNAIAGLSADQARAAFDQLSGEIHASTQSALLADSHFVRRAMDDRLLGAAGHAASTAQAVMTYNEQGEQQLAPADADGFVVWEQAFGSWASMDGDGNAAKLDHDTGGFFIGADAPLGSAWRLGAVAGYSHSSFSVDARASSTSSRNYHLGLYSGRQWGALGLRFGGAYTWHDIEASRSVSFRGFSDRPTADYHAGTAQAFSELGYSIGLGDVVLEPFANLAYVNLHSEGFSEKGGDAALAVDSATTDATFTTIGSRVSGDFDLAGVKMTAQGSLGWQHAMGDTSPHSRHAFNGGDDFTISGVPIAKDAAIIEAGVGFALAPNTTLGVAYQGQLADDARENGFKMKLDVRF